MKGVCILHTHKQIDGLVVGGIVVAETAAPGYVRQCLEPRTTVRERAWRGTPGGGDQYTERADCTKGDEHDLGIPSLCVCKRGKL